MEEENKKINKLKITTILLIVICALFIIGLTSYAVFNINLTGTSNIVGRPAKLSLTYIEQEEPLISDIAGLSIEEGKIQNEYFEFTVSSISETSFSVQYNIYLTENETNNVNRDRIYVYLTEIIDGSEVEVLEPTKLSSFSSYYKYDNSYIIKSDWFPFETTVETTQERTYRLRLWIDGSVNVITNEDESQSINVSGGVYEYKVNVDTFATPEHCFEYTKDDTAKTATITNYLCYEGNTDDYDVITYIAIPDIIDGYDVTTVGERAFEAKKLTGVAIPDSIKIINSYAFYNNSISGHLEIPDSITSIQPFAFAINGIESIDISNSMKSINAAVFMNNKLTSITTKNIPDTITYIGNSAFKNNLLTNVELPNSVATLDSYAFSDNLIRTVVLPENLKTIPSYLFISNQLENIIIPDSVTSIGAYAFRTNNLTSLTIPEGVTSIGEWAFGDNNLKTVEIPSSITTIENATFIDNKLKSVTIPESVTSIGPSAFRNNSITSITIPDAVTSIGTYAFYINSISEVLIPENVTIIEDYAFWGNILKSVKIKGKTSSSDFTTYGQYLWQWDTGYTDSNIEWNYSE